MYCSIKEGVQWGIEEQKEMVTHCGEIHRVAILSSKCALQQHVTDVMTCAVVEISHVEQFGFEVLEVCLILEGSQNLGLRQVWVGDLVVIIEEGQKLPHMIEVISGDFRKAELVEVTEGNSWESEIRRRHLIQFGDVRVLQVV